MLTTKDIEHAQLVDRMNSIYNAKYKAAGLRYLYGEDERRSDVIEVIENLPKKISRTFASMMFLEQYTLTYEGKDQAIGDNLRNILYANGFQKKLYQSAHAQSKAGYAAFEISKIGNKAVITSIKPDYVFITPNPISAELEPLEVKIAWIFESEKRKCLFVRIHTSTEIKNQVFFCDAVGNPIGSSMSPVNFGFNVKDSEEQFTQGIPVFVIQNDLHDIGEVYGTSDFLDNESLFQELARNQSQISNELHHFGNAMLAVPAGVINPQTGRPRVAGAKMIQIDTDEKTFVPQYIVNSNPQIDKAMMNGENILRAICRSTDIAELLLGLNTQGGAERVGALRLRLLLTLARVKAKLHSYHTVLPQLVAFASRVEGKEVDAKDIYFEFHDGLPTDLVEKVDSEVKRYNAGLQSLSDAIKNLDNLDAEELKNKVEEIRAEESRFALPPITN